MKIEAVTVSINYSDFLIKCVRNKCLFDKWIIVTHETDTKTIKICKDFKLDYIFSNRIYEENAVFAKGRAINEGLDKLDKDGWLLQLDSDIQLPQNFRTVINKMNLDVNTMYWMDRYNEGVKINHYNNWKCLGYFQLWHSSIVKIYPEISRNAGYDDLLHRDFFAESEDKKIEKLNFKCADVSGKFGCFHNGRKVTF